MGKNGESQGPWLSEPPEEVAVMVAFLASDDAGHVPAGSRVFTEVTGLPGPGDRIKGMIYCDDSKLVFRR